MSATQEGAILVVFGATGDLTHRKLIPAVAELHRTGLLKRPLRIVGYARQDLDDESFRDLLRQTVEGEGTDAVIADTCYVRGDFQDAEGYQRLRKRLAELEKDSHSAGRVYYLAAPPSFYTDIFRGIGEADLAKEDGGFRRIVVEKPFGRDLKTAQDLNTELHQVFQESQVFRIDHYLGKETVQNILVLRFANGIFEPLWNRRYIDHVQITVAESLGVEHRGRYYEEAGALRDMMQNHLLQLMTLIAMEPPVAFDADAVRNEKVKVLRAVRLPSPQEVPHLTVRGQYGPGDLDGKPVPGYRQESDVPPDSIRETFAAFKLKIENWRWADVPFYLRTGKRLERRASEISVQFQRAPQRLFPREARLKPNVLRLRIQPDEGITLSVGAKVPGMRIELRDVEMEFDYDAFGRRGTEAYERLLHDALIGDGTLFTRKDEVEAAWQVVDAIERGWQQEEAGPEIYPAGSWGPESADELLHHDGRRWHLR
ncbi:MAG: glucose-6-phosphate dehydrogenase [Thermaerobacter sp.]|nr:glucose-6-phosphate dehydrogenase [Thermaerobacter sp.]